VDASRSSAAGVGRSKRKLPLHQAIALGALQGPAELLPISSSGHLVLVPALLGWSYTELDDELRKSFEVALHAGTAAALLIALRREVAEALRELDGERLARHALTFIPPGLAALALERPIERRLGSPRGVAAAQVVAGMVLAAADRAPAERPHEDAGAADALALGVAQACALAPGVSRNGATLTAARLLRFERRAANRLSRHAALPIILSAAGLKGLRLWRRGLPRELAAPFAVGAGAAFTSTLASSRLVSLVDGARSYLPFAGYRVALGALALVRLSERAPDSSARSAGSSSCA
jgi:undecaprenyl-diphosphatase